MIMAYSFWPAPALVPSPECTFTGAYHGGRDDSNPMRERDKGCSFFTVHTHTLEGRLDFEAKQTLIRSKDASFGLRSSALDRYLSSLNTISDVEVSNDLQIVKVYVSVFGDDRGKEVATVTMERNQGGISTAKTATLLYLAVGTLDGVGLEQDRREEMVY
ncbi:hypothetical protein Bca4012_064554 [Brassica carinata]